MDEGYDVAVIHPPAGGAWPAIMGRALDAERLLFRRDEPGLATIVPEIPETPRRREASLRIDLVGDAPPGEVPTLRLVFDGRASDATAVTALAEGQLPTVETVLDGQVVARALPMVDKRKSTALGADDVFARAVTLMLSSVKAFEEGHGFDRGAAPREKHGPDVGTIRFASSYLTSALPRLGREALRRLWYRHAHWRVGYRLADRPGVAETGVLGTGWSVLPDNGEHFYADPFAFEQEGRYFIFVEDYPHSTGKAVISVFALGDDGRAEAPRQVLEEPHHLSYPQVFERDGAIWMLPEASASGTLTLYRAARFPDEWVPEAVLIEGREISDATLLDHDARLWLFATDRDGHGSTSDTMVVFHAPALTGPWTPHPMNPVLIDRRRARPGGAFVHVDGRIVLPVQDGTLGYGGGLGLSELLELTPQTVKLSPPRPIAAEGDWPYPQIHTLNRCGRLEVIDGIAAVRKHSGGNE